MLSLPSTPTLTAQNVVDVDRTGRSHYTAVLPRTKMGKKQNKQRVGTDTTDVVRAEERALSSPQPKFGQALASNGSPLISTRAHGCPAVLSLLTCVTCWSSRR